MKSLFLSGILSGLFNTVSIFNFNEQMKSMLIVTLVLAIIIIILGLLIRRVDPKKKTPLWLVPIVWIVSIINDFTKTNIGKRWKTYAPYFLTVAIYLFVLNISAIFCQTTPTTYIVINFAFGITTFFIIQITGIISLGLGGYLKSFVGPVWWLAFLFIPINIIRDIYIDN